MVGTDFKVLDGGFVVWDGIYFNVLDDGFIGLVDVMGDDYSVEQAARVSYGKGTRKVSETRGLLRYLMRHHHWTPFEMCEMKFHVRVPMDCWRQWIRHRTASVNEYSTRYSEAINSCQKTKPTEWRLQAKDNKQGSSGFLTEWWEEDNPVGWQEQQKNPGQYLSTREEYFHKISRDLYEERLKAGIAREQARKDLPLSTYTEAYWKCDLRNIFNFITLRCDSHAQLEIRTYANIMAGFVKEAFPLCFEAWYDYHFGAINLSRGELQLVTKYGINHIKDFSADDLEEDLDEFKLSKREFDELVAKLNKTTTMDAFDLSKYDRKSANSSSAIQT